MSKTSTAILHPIAFGCRRTRGNKKRLHFHLGKGFSGNWSINKCRHMCIGQRFIWVTDCYTIKFILSYDGKTHAILRLQMRFMCWEMDIKHCNDHFLTDTNYWFQLGADLTFNPLLRDYIKQVQALKLRSPSPMALLPTPKNMPYFRGPQLPVIPLPSPADDTCNAAVNHFSHSAPSGGEIVLNLQHLSTYLVCFGYALAWPCHDTTSTRALYNLDLMSATSILAKYDWAIYGFNSGHFSSTFCEHGMSFYVVIGCDLFANRRALFKEICACPAILSSTPALLDHVCGSGITTPLTGYLILLHRYTSTEPTS